MATTTFREIERKFDATESTTLPRWATLAGEAEISDEELILEATYYDTEDLRLAGAGITLRHRSGDGPAGWDLKLPVAADTRDEIRARGSARRPPATLEALTRSATRGAELVPVAVLRTVRRQSRWTGDGGRDLLAVVDDAVTAAVALPGGRESAWREIEVELGRDGDPRTLDLVDAALREAGARRAAAPSKLARALGELVPAATDHGAGPRSDAGAMALAYIATQADAIRRQDPLVRRDEPDSVHQMRVATRRLRSALQAYGSVLERDQTRALTDELKWLAEALGAARDLEVLRARFAAAVAAQPRADLLGPVRARLDKHFAPRQKAARDALLAALDSDRYLGLLAALDGLLAAPPRTARAARRAHAVAPALLARANRRVERRLAEADEGGPGRDVALHEARKAAKRLRYAAEAAAPVLGAPARRLAKRASTLQSVLGEHQDAVVARPALREIGIAAHQSGENAFSFGVLHGAEGARTQLDADALAPARRSLSKAARKVR